MNPGHPEINTEIIIQSPLTESLSVVVGTPASYVGVFWGSNLGPEVGYLD
jgi:hypothetical protein